MARARTEAQRATEAALALAEVTCSTCAHWLRGAAERYVGSCCCDPDLRTRNSLACYRYRRVDEKESHA